MPRVTVAFETKNGSTAEVAGWIAGRLREHDLQVELAQARTATIGDRGSRPDLVIPGGAIYPGHGVGLLHLDLDRPVVPEQRREPDLGSVPG